MRRTKVRTLAAAKASAEDACHAKSQSLANMSHEIRTPLNGVLGMTELLLESELTERQRRFADTAHRSAKNLLDTLNDILDLSEIEAGQLELESVDFDLRCLVEDLAERFAERCHEKGLELVCAISGKMPTALSGDPSRLRQILSNLVGKKMKEMNGLELAHAILAIPDLRGLEVILLTPGGRARPVWRRHAS